MRFLIITVIGLTIIIAVSFATYDDGRCGKAGGVRVRTTAIGFRVACVKPIDLERN